MGDLTMDRDQGSKAAWNEAAQRHTEWLYRRIHSPERFLLAGVTEDDVERGTQATIIDERPLDRRFWDPNGKRAPTDDRLTTRPATVAAVERWVLRRPGLYGGAILFVRAVDDASGREYLFRRDTDDGNHRSILGPCPVAYDALHSAAELTPVFGETMSGFVCDRAFRLLIGERQLDARIVEATQCRAIFSPRYPHRDCGLKFVCTLEKGHDGKCVGRRCL